MALGRIGLVTLLATLTAATPAFAHEGTGLAGGFLSGILHPLTGWDHLLAMVAVGLWGAILGRPLIIALPVIFPVMMVAGAFLAMVNVPLPPVEFGIALSVVVLGAVIAFRYAAPVWLACTIVAVFAVFHGYAHGMELPSAADPAGYSTGFVLSTGLLHIVGIGIGLIDRHETGRKAVRALGALISIAGCVFLWKAIA
ncbi:Ni/Fe hydrogenase [Asticcacaulis sp. AC460]|uniref:HupE/UreJ family protein n=1 Tax=Asticcacaulis sp. AC460 TaxID=1282360 RepID=UPI0003C3F68B|nr:HupE/UreJ family protein [Asticcacaulis sp. AC460]ESQ90307.1 Ni/Fe hydrogenase [Asticcacaulis sp. AC460]